MKWMLLFSALLLGAQAFAQCGETGDTLVVNSTAELNALSGCTAIEGSLLISEPAISGLTALSSLESVEEHLLIHDNISLLSVGGLGSLQSVGGNLELFNNFTLQNLNGFSDLESIGGHLRLHGNITMVHFDALAGCAIGGDIELLENHTIESLNGFSELTVAQGNLIINHEQLILSDLSGLSNLTSVAGNLEISLPQLTEVAGLYALQSVGGDVLLQNMPLLANLDGLEAMQTVGGMLWIEGNPSMVNINALAGLDEIGDAHVMGNPALMWCCCVANWELNQAVQGTALFEGNHPACNEYALIVADCEPLSIKDTADQAGFEPGFHRVWLYTLSGALVTQQLLWLNYPEDVYRVGRPGVSMLYIQPEHAGQGWVELIAR